jgi:hypothetical protein
MDDTKSQRRAVARPPRHFPDSLSFVKEDGRWWIISKVFEARQLPPPS